MCKKTLVHHRYIFVFLASCAAPVSSDDSTLDAGKPIKQPQNDASLNPPDSSDSDSAMDDVAMQDSPADNIVVDSNGSCGSPYNGTIATYDFTGEPGNQASTAAKSSAPGLTAGAISRSNALTPISGLSSINSSNWTLASKLDATRYYTLTLTPPANCMLDVTQVSIDTKSSNTGPASASIATSDDNFSATTAFAPNSVATAAISVSGSTKAVEVRIYGFSASSSAGTMRVQTMLKLTGALK